MVLFYITDNYEEHYSNYDNKEKDKLTLLPSLAKQTFIPPVSALGCLTFLSLANYYSYGANSEVA